MTRGSTAGKERGKLHCLPRCSGKLCNAANKMKGLEIAFQNPGEDTLCTVLQENKIPAGHQRRISSCCCRSLFSSKVRSRRYVPGSSAGKKTILKLK